MLAIIRVNWRSGLLLGFLGVGMVTNMSSESARVAAEDIPSRKAPANADQSPFAAETEIPALAPSLSDSPPPLSESEVKDAPTRNRNWDRKHRSPLVRRIEAALPMPNEVNFTDTPLIEALKYLADVHNIPMEIDHRALQDEGVSEEQPVSIQSSNVSFKSVLGMMLEQNNLDYVIRNEVLLITTRSLADSLTEVRVYNVGRLNGFTLAELEEIIGSTVAPGTWDQSQISTKSRDYKPAQMQALAKSEPESPPRPGVIRATRNALIIRHSQRVHDEISELLTQLDTPELPQGLSPTPTAH
jgi:type II secretory pathway component GspD/PulD (secretin)